MTRAQTPGEVVEKHKIARKSHRKSRNGCDNCKRRRIKCNEEWPRCSNCVKHDDLCSFSTKFQKTNSSSPGNSIRNVATPSISDGLLDLGLSSQSTSPGDTFGTPRSVLSTAFDTPRSVPGAFDFIATAHPRLQPAFSLVDMELFHNYQTATCHTLSGIPELQAFMRVEVPRVGFSHSFVLDSILAVSALHLAYFKKDQREFYIGQAEQHYEVALRVAVNLLPAINVQNCPALYLFASFCSSYTMALGPQKGNFLLFSDSGVTEWRMLYKGVRTIIESNQWILTSNELAPMFEIAIRQITCSPSNNPHLLDLRDHIVATTADERSLNIYLSALDGLQKAFPMEPPEGNRGAPNTSQHVFTWLYRVHDDFVECLQRREPIALVILGYFCVLLNDLGSVWWAHGWVNHLMSEIHASLTGEHKMWMRWPIEEIGWIPS